MTSIFRTIALQAARILLKPAVDRALQKELPAIYARLDLELPFLLNNKAQPLWLNGMMQPDKITPTINT